MKRTIYKLFTASVLACAASVSQAAVVTDWGFVLDMKWDTSPCKVVDGKQTGVCFDAGIPNTSPGTGKQIVTSTELSWGSADSRASYHNPDTRLARSGLVITQPHVTGSIATSFEGQAITAVDANMFRHYSSAITSTFKTLTQAPMDVTVQLLLPGTGDSVVNLSKSFDVHFWETPNTGGMCSWGPCNDDIFAVISKMDLTSTFVYGGQEYTLNYFEVNNQLKELSAVTCKEMGFATGSCYGFATPEGYTTDVKFNFSITTTPIPEPETYSMLLAGLGMIGIVVRRRRSAIYK